MVGGGHQNDFPKALCLAYFPGEPGVFRSVAAFGIGQDILFRNAAGLQQTKSRLRFNAVFLMHQPPGNNHRHMKGTVQPQSHKVPVSRAGGNLSGAVEVRHVAAGTASQYNNGLGIPYLTEGRLGVIILQGLDDPVTDRADAQQVHEKQNRQQFCEADLLPAENTHGQSRQNEKPRRHQPGVT